MEEFYHIVALIEAGNIDQAYGAAQAHADVWAQGDTDLVMSAARQVIRERKRGPHLVVS
jgi:hypothetical protein